MVASSSGWYQDGCRNPIKEDTIVFLSLALMNMRNFSLESPRTCHLASQTKMSQIPIPEPTFEVRGMPSADWFRSGFLKKSLARRITLLNLAWIKHGQHVELRLIF